MRSHRNDENRTTIHPALDKNFERSSCQNTLLRRKKTMIPKSIPTSLLVGLWPTKNNNGIRMLLRMGQLLAAAKSA